MRRLGRMAKDSIPVRGKPVPRLKGGLPVLGREPQWTGFTVGAAADAIEISGRIEAPASGEEKTVLARVRVFDAGNRSLDHLLAGLRRSEAAGRYFLPMEYVRDGVFRFSFRLPQEAARIEVALHHWRKADTTVYRGGRLALTPVDAVVNVPSRVIPAPPDAALEKLRQAEQALKQSLREYASRLVAVPGPLHADFAPFGEPLVEYLAHDEGDADLAERLAGRRLRAGRDHAALGLIGLAETPELRKAYGRSQLHERMAHTPAHVHGKPRIRQRSLAYLMHNSLPHASGGYATRSHGLLRGFVEAGWRVHAFTRPGFPGDRGADSHAASDEIDGVVYHRLDVDQAVDGPDQAGYVAAYAQRLADALRPLDVGFIQAASFYQNGLAGRIVADQLDVPLVYEMRGMEWLTRSSNDPRWLDSDQCRTMRELEFRAARDADHVFAITGALKAWLMEAGMDEARIGVLPNGCSTDQFGPVERDRALAERLGLGEAYVVAYIGSFAEYEDVTSIVTGVSRARDISGQDIRLLLVGDGQCASAIEAHIESTGASGHVVSTGRVPHDEAPRYYSLADALVLARHDIPLTRMISPVKPLEALAMGKHVISTDVAAVREILEAADAGRLVPPNAPYGLAHAIAEAATARDQWRAKADDVRRWTVNERDWSVIARQALEDLQARFGAPRRAGGRR